MAIEDTIIKTGIKAGTGTVMGAVAAIHGSASAPHINAMGQAVTNQAAKAGFAGMNSWRHAHKLLPAVGAGAAVFAGPAIAAATVAAPVVLGVAVGAATAAAVYGVGYGVYKFFKD